MANTHLVAEAVLTNADYLRCIVHQCARRAHIVDTRVNPNSGKTYAVIDKNASVWLRQAVILPLVSSHWRAALASDALWRELLHVRWPVLADQAGDLRALYFRLSGFCRSERSTAWADVIFLLEVYFGSDCLLKIARPLHESQIVTDDLLDGAHPSCPRQYLSLQVPELAADPRLRAESWCSFEGYEMNMKLLRQRDGKMVHLTAQSYNDANTFGGSTLDAVRIRHYADTPLQKANVRNVHLESLTSQLVSDLEIQTTLGVLTDRDELQLWFERSLDQGAALDHVPEDEQLPHPPINMTVDVSVLDVLDWR